MPVEWRFPIMVAASFVVFAAVLHLALRSRREPPRAPTIAMVSAVVVIGGMAFAKTGASGGWPVWLYYGVPALLTWVLPPLVFRMRTREVVRYLPMALLVAPAIHLAFSFVLGWREYMPFLPF
jgi:hypothetical protein